MSAQQPVAQFDFLSSYVEKVLAENGLGGLTEENKKAYVPRITAEAERRIGLALTPKLSEMAAKEFFDILNDQNADIGKLEAFWKKNVPDFYKIVNETLETFALEIRDLLTDK